MKKLFTLLSIISILFISCEGEVGPPGRDGLDGLDGLDGINILGQIFEAQIDFNSENDFSALVDFPSEIEVFDTDVVIAYILVGDDNGTDIWEPLPQTLFFNDGILLYGFNHTFSDILFFLDGTVSLGDLTSELTQDVIFRVAILPADAAQNLDTNNIENVLNYLQHEEIIKLDWSFILISNTNLGGYSNEIFNFNNFENSVFYLFDLLGSYISIEQNFNSIRNITSIKLGNLSSGIYILKADNNSYKIIVNWVFEKNFSGTHHIEF